MGVIFAVFLLSLLCSSPPEGERSMKERNVRGRI
jgi:hypothetical protein